MAALNASAPRFNPWIKADDVANPLYPKEFASCLVQSLAGSLRLGYWVRQEGENRWYEVRSTTPIRDIDVSFVSSFADYGVAPRA